MPHFADKSSFETYRDGATTSSISALVKMVVIVRQFRNQLDERLRNIGQSTARMEMLSAILNIKGPKSQSDLAKRLRVEGATITRMIDILSNEGLVERSPDSKDRRVNLISISPKGEIVLERIFEIYDELRFHILDGLAPEDIDTLHRLFDHMIVRLEQPAESKVRIGLPRYERRHDSAQDT
jgi:MarR family transcriptional regulator, transcriptional regulator for hemolysin